MVFLKNLLEILVILLQVGDEFAARFGQFLGDVLRNLANPLGLANAILGFVSSLTGIILAKTGTFYWPLAADAMEKQTLRPISSVEEFGKPYQHVMTPANALRWVGSVFEEFIKAATGTSERDVLDVILGAAGRWFWRVFTGSGPLRQILKILRLKTEAEAIEFIGKKILGRLAMIELRAFLLLFVAFIVFSSAYVSQIFFIGLTIIAPKSWEKWVLNFKNPREKQTVRLRRRVGGVRP